MSMPLESPGTANQQIVELPNPGASVQTPIVNPNLYDYLSLVPVMITAVTPLVLGFRNKDKDKDKDEDKD